MKIEPNFLKEKFITGDSLYGDNFDENAIKDWYEKESQSYGNQFHNATLLNGYNYQYNALNSILGFNRLEKKKFKNILSFGGALGYEIECLVPYAENVYIIEPSKSLRRKSILGKQIHYLDPSADGKVDFPDGFFDIITCFGVLMYIPNVSFVLSELIRCLTESGYILIREPITSLEIGQQYRIGCGINTRGIPYQYFKKWVNNYKFEKVEMTPNRFGPLVKFFHFLRIGVYNNVFITRLDVFFCKLFMFNYKYTRRNIWDKFAPGSIFITIKK